MTMWDFFVSRRRRQAPIHREPPATPAPPRANVTQQHPEAKVQIFVLAPNDLIVIELGPGEPSFEKLEFLRQQIRESLDHHRVIVLTHGTRMNIVRKGGV